MPLGHLGINVPDLRGAKAYYDAVMPLLGYEPFMDSSDEFAFRPAGAKVGTFLFFYPSAEQGEYSRHRCGLQHLAFMVNSRERVREVHDLALSLGDEILHQPKEFPQYHPGYFATFWLDPFGHMLEAVCHKNQQV
jgi:catechol 2,3-dioxygenase-like lactoylglutathione lyase family enzyme